jgi:hypothetical protein
MSDDTSWRTAPAADVQPGDRVRMRGFEFTVARVDQRFLGRDEMLCLIEDTPDRWMAYPAPVTAEIEVAAS